MPRTGSVTPDPVETRHGVRCADGLRLTAEQTAPRSGWNGGVIIIAGALAVPTSFYRGLAGFLAGRGYRIIRFTYRGMTPAKWETEGHPIRLRDWGCQDIEAMIQSVREHHKPERLLMLGHSVGGQLLGLAPSAAVEALLAQYRKARIRRFRLRAEDYDCPQLGHFRLFSRAMEGSFWVELVNRLDEM